jgi:hypothetical protein
MVGAKKARIGQLVKYGQLMPDGAGGQARD